MDPQRLANIDEIRSGGAPEAWLLPQIRLWSSTQLARYLGVARYTLTRRIEAGHHPATKFDGRHFFTTEQVSLAVRYHRENGQETSDLQARELGEPLRFEELSNPDV